LKLLLDTCTFLWLNIRLSQVSPLVRRLCTDQENELYLSVVSTWEIAVKHQAGRLWLPEPVGTYVPKRRASNGIESLALDEDSVSQLAKLPPLHNDPFDRMLICQAITHGLGILTPDEWITQYPVRVLW
jgi:PIN domain nuclease of toxin-antitoxin system